MKIKSEKLISKSKCDLNNNNNNNDNDDNNNNLTTETSIEFDESEKTNSHEMTTTNHCSNSKTNVARKLHSAILKGDFNELLLLLSTKPDLNVFINGQTALHHCLLLGRDVSWCQQLVNNGANPNLSNKDGWHPIHLAAFNGLHESLTYLITCNSKNYNE